MLMGSIDQIENIRRNLAAEINSRAAERTDLETRHGRVWNSAELVNDFEVLEFAAPFAVVKRKTDNQLGSLVFQHHPRYYFSFKEDK